MSGQYLCLCETSSLTSWVPESSENLDWLCNQKHPKGVGETSRHVTWLLWCHHETHQDEWRPWVRRASPSTNQKSQSACRGLARSWTRTERFPLNVWRHFSELCVCVLLSTSTSSRLSNQILCTVQQTAESPPTLYLTHERAQLHFHSLHSWPLTFSWPQVPARSGPGPMVPMR